MSHTTNAGSDRAFRLTVLCIVWLFAVITLVRVIVRKDFARFDVAIELFVLALLPFLLEKLFSCRVSKAMFLYIELYLIGYPLGHCYKLYFHTTWFDKILHISGGVGFALLGFWLFRLLLFGREGGPLDAKKLRTGLFCALCFSVAIAAVWELIEFAGDAALGTDAQTDTVIHEIHSFRLSDEPGAITSITQIADTAVSGFDDANYETLTLPTGGYIDIGLIDTMLDIAVELAGAVVTVIILWLDKARHPGFYPREERAAAPAT